MPTMIALRFYLASPIQRTALLFLTSKTSVDIWSDFFSLGFMTVKESPGDIGLLLVNLLGVDTNDS